MTGGWVHDIDPVLGRIGDLYLWWYGSAYTVGFLGIFLWLRRSRFRLGLSTIQVYDLSIILALSVLLGARVVEVIFYEWSYYRNHLAQIGAFWLGGMSTHGVLAGSVLGIWLFCRHHGKKFLHATDELTIPGAIFMGVGRIGNFIDGQIVGAPAEVWWAVQFPDVEGFRHPVVMYDGVKNLLLVPLLLVISKRRPAPGVITGHFIFWYGFLRIFADLFREYRVTLLGLGPGQGFNLLMALIGLVLMWSCSRTPRWRDLEPRLAGARRESPGGPLWPRILALVFLLVFPLMIPSDWTQDVPDRYGRRHPGMEHSALYPEIEEGVGGD